MRRCLIALCVVMGSVHAAEPVRSRYLIEFTEAPALNFAGNSQFKATAVVANARFDADTDAVRSYVGELAHAQSAWLKNAERLLGRPLAAVQHYRYTYNGVALDLSPSEVTQLAGQTGVRRIEADALAWVSTDAGPAWIGASAAWNGVAGANATRGEGMIVGIVDTGINIDHPAFAEVDADGYRHQNPRSTRYGLCLSSLSAGCNNKLIGVHDFTDEAPRNGLDVDGHGSHVAGTAAGNVRSTTINGITASLQLRLSGVAPRANLISYKACVAGTNGNPGSCPNSATLAALDQAVADGVDVINYSIGGSASDPWPTLTGGGNSAPMRAMANAVRAGIAVAVAAGNEGPVAGSMQSPANSPWVLAVANATSDRRIANVLTDLSGADSAPPVVQWVGAGLAGGVGPVRIVLGEQFGSARCSQGTSLDSPPTGVSNPWVGRVFNGEIVVCDRGVQARVAKGANVASAGGGGMVLVNTAAEGESTVSDDHYIAATHLGYSDGELLKTWVRANPNGARGRLTGVQSLRDPAFGDVLASSSSRGPEPTGAGILKPNLTAPGSSILAPSDSGTAEATLSGTSMASPHVAGALALLRSQRRGESPGTLASAFELTAAPGVRYQDGVSIATPFDAGMGRTRVDRALAAGLVLPISISDFERENPASGGDPSRLNLAALYRSDCTTRCTFTRTLRAWRAGSYQVSDTSSGGVRIQASPSSFTLGVGQTQTLSIEVDVSDPRVLGRWAFGELSISSDDPTIPVSRLRSVMRSTVGSLPDQISIQTSSDRGSHELTLSGLVALPALSFQLDGPVPATAETLSIPVDPTASDAFDSNTGTETRLIDLTAAGTIRADTTQSSARDIDLYVGRDSNNNGLAEESELLCKSTSSGVAESCVLNDQAAGRYWARVQNYANTSVNDSVVLQTAAIAAGASSNRAGAATGPSVAAAGANVPVLLSFDVGGLKNGERAYASLALRAGTGGQTTFARIPVAIERVGETAPGAYYLADGRSARFLLPPGGGHERLVVDIPTGASGLTVEMRGSEGNASLYLAKAIDNSIGADLPPAPPEGAAAASSNGADSNETITLNVPALTPGRWYVVARNGGAAAVPVDITARVSGSESTAFAFEAWFNPARDGHGLFFTRAGSSAQMVWYSYDNAGQPTWYLAFPDGLATNTGHASSDLYRYVWINGSALGTRVGKVSLVRQTGRLVFDWELDGRSGSEAMVLLTSSSCVSGSAGSFDPSGLWFEPARSGYGANLFVRPDVDLAVLYLFGNDGRARWLLGQNASFGSTPLQLFQYSGFCPSCAAVAVQRQAVGSFSRNFDSAPVAGAELSGRWSINASFLAPLAGSWTANDVATQLLTARKACTP